MVVVILQTSGNYGNSLDGKNDQMSCRQDHDANPDEKWLLDESEDGKTSTSAAQWRSTTDPLTPRTNDR